MQQHPRRAHRVNSGFRARRKAHMRAIARRKNRRVRSLQRWPHRDKALMQQAKALLNQAAQFASFSRALHGEPDGELVISANSDPVKSRIGEIFATLREWKNQFK